MSSKTKIAILASGSGSNAEKIINYFKNSQEAEGVSVISNRKNAIVLDRAQKAGIETQVFSKTEFEAAKPIIQYLNQKEADIIVLAGFLLKISPLIIGKYPNKIINIHPALLPKYGGKGMYGDFVHEAVKAAGEKETGITIHLVNENYDEGRIVFQTSTPVTEADTPGSIAEKVHALEHTHFPEVIEGLL